MFSQSELQKTIGLVDKHHARLASTRLAAGITRLILLALNPPKDVWNGTSFSSASELPSEISVRDDLILIANLLKHRELTDLVDAILEMPRVSGDQIAMSASNLGEALKQVTEQATDRNPPFRFTLDSDKNIARVSITSHDALGDFGRIYELLGQAILFRLIMSFLEYAENKAESVGSITFSCRIFDQEIISRFSRSNWLRVKRSAQETSISLPVILLASPNPSVFDGPVGTGRSVTANADQAINTEFDIEQLKRAIDISLRLENRTVQLDEVAQRFGLSHRTVLRKIAESGSTLRQISIDRRMARACELLGDPSTKISDVSSAAGYSDPSSFVRAFKRRYGTSPHRWRRDAHPETSIV